MSFYCASDLQYTPGEAIWGPPTSTLNFCEEDYEFTPYIAELFNTVTNITYISLGIHGIFNAGSLGLRGIGPRLPSLALIHLGLMSSLFHSTLKYPTQLCDESAMIIATFIVFYQLLCFSQSRFSPSTLLLLLSTTASIIIFAQYWTQESTVQQVVFTIMVYWLWHTCFRLIRSMDNDDSKTKNRMWWMAISGIAFFVFGHACWVIDFRACASLRTLRGRVGMPWAAALELHGFWHIFTGIGVYIFMVLVQCLRYVQPNQGTDRLRVDSSGTWPFMVSVAKRTPAVGTKKTE